VPEIRKRRGMLLLGQIVFYLPVAVFIYTLFRVIEERNNRISKGFNLNALVMVACFIVISFISGFSIGKVLAYVGVGISVLFIVLSKSYYRIGFVLCALASVYLAFWIL
jgi:hypothetical protein